MLRSLWVILFAIAVQTPSKAPQVKGVGEWDIILIVDPWTDARPVALASSGVIVKLSNQGKPEQITTYEHDCRAKPLILSVDRNKAILLGEQGRRHVERAIRQMLRGKQAVLAYYAQPCEELQYLEINLDGFAPTLEKAKHLSDEDLEALEAQVVAQKKETEREEAEKRLVANPSRELLLAARDGNVVHVIAALDAGADVNVKTETNGYTALIWAAARGHQETVRLLLEAGASVNLQTVDGQTALMRASDNGHLEAIQLLLDADADVHIETERGITALLLAELKNHTPVVELLKQAGAQR